MFFRVFRGGLERNQSFCTKIHILARQSRRVGADASVQTRRRRRVGADPSELTHRRRQVGPDRSEQTRRCRRLGVDASARTRRRRRVGADASAQTRRGREQTCRCRLAAASCVRADVFGDFLKMSSAFSHIIFPFQMSRKCNFLVAHGGDPCGGSFSRNF